MVHKKIFKTILVSAVAFILAACLSVTALSISSVGETGSGGGSTGTSTHFAIADDSDEGGIVGYRFSIVDDKGDMLAGTKAVDILCSSSKDYDLANRDI